MHRFLPALPASPSLHVYQARHRFLPLLLIVVFFFFGLASFLPAATISISTSQRFHPPTATLRRATMPKVDDRREYERVAYERDRDRRGDERVRYEDEDLAYTNSSRRPAPPPTRLRERSPSPLARGRGSERTFEDEERILRERRYFEEEDDIDSVILPSSARRRQHPPPVIPSDFDREVTVDREKLRVREDERVPQRQQPPRPGQLIRRQSSLDTFDRRPARRAYDYERLEDNREHRGPRTGVPIPLPRRHPRESSVERTSERFARRDEGRDRESSFASEFDELRIEPGRYRPPPSDLHPRPRPADDHERDYFRQTEVVRTRREEESRSRSRSRGRGRTGRSSSVSSEETEATNAGRNEYPKKGKTRIPARLVSERALVDLRYPFIREVSKKQRQPWRKTGWNAGLYQKSGVL